jgi:hypothetical protein
MYIEIKKIGADVNSNIGATKQSIMVSAWIKCQCDTIYRINYKIGLSSAYLPLQKFSIQIECLSGHKVKWDRKRNTYYKKVAK